MHKRHLEDRSENESLMTAFQRIFNEAMMNLYKEDKLYHSSNNQSVSKYLSDILKNEMNLKRVLIFTSKPFIGFEYLIQDMLTKPNVYMINEEEKKILTSDLNDSNLTAKLIKAITQSVKYVKENNIYIVKNFQIEVYLELAQYSKGSLKEQLKVLKKTLYTYLNLENKVKSLFVFLWDDGTSDNFRNMLRKTLGEEIVMHKNLEIINFTPPHKKELRPVIDSIKNKFNLTFLSDKKHEVLLETFDGNLQKMKYFFEYEISKKELTKLKLEAITNEMSRSRSKSKGRTASKVYSQQVSNFSHKLGSKDKEQINHLSNSQVGSTRKKNYPGHNRGVISTKPIPSDNQNINRSIPEIEKSFDFFHIIGKVIYNKRLDKKGVKRPMSPEEMKAIPAPKSYFNLLDLLNNLPCDQIYFNEFLIENSYDHFTEIKELAQVTESYSHTDLFSKHIYKEKNSYELGSLDLLRSQMNSLAYMSFNKSQYANNTSNYNNNKLLWKSMKKPIIMNINALKRSNSARDIYISSIRVNPGLARIGLKKFALEIKDVVLILKKQKEYRNGKKRNNPGNGSNDLLINRRNGEEDILEEVKLSNDLAEEDKILELLKISNTAETRSIAEWGFKRRNKVTEKEQLEPSNNISRNIICKVNNRETEKKIISEYADIGDFLQHNLDNFLYLFENDENNSTQKSNKVVVNDKGEEEILF